ncbi:hypothetical protein BC629DRAFT_1596400 [Irpex lacteus]|nr:hypothetical protein BC629DRAFT_1596400 [Irpex lacteus]
MAHVLSTGILVIPSCVGAEMGVGIPSAWKDHPVNSTRQERIHHAQSAIDTLRDQFNVTGQMGQKGYYSFYNHQTANVLGSIALHDSISGTTRYQKLVTENLGKLHSEAVNPYVLHPIHVEHFSCEVDSKASDVDRLSWALSAMYAYRAYRNNTFLNQAKSVWEARNQYFITQGDAESGTHPTRTVGFQSECNNVSVIGGMFNSDEPSSNTLVRSEVLGGFSALSAYLLEATNETEYRQAADLSSQFLVSQLYNHSVILEFVNLTSCKRTNTEAHILQTGLLIEGLSVYLNQTMNSTVQDALDQIVTSSIFGAWTGLDGINTYQQGDAKSNNGQRGQRACYIRGLYTAWSRNVLSPDVANLTQAYLNVQYRAVNNLATVKGTNLYSSDWHGPAANTLQPWGQMEALSTLNYAIDAAVENPSSNSSQIMNSTPATSSESRTTSRAKHTSSSTAHPKTSSEAKAALLAANRSKIRLCLLATLVPLVGISFLVSCTLLFLRARKQYKKRDDLEKSSDSRQDFHVIGTPDSQPHNQLVLEPPVDDVPPIPASMYAESHQLPLSSTSSSTYPGPHVAMPPALSSLGVPYLYKGTSNLYTTENTLDPSVEDNSSMITQQGSSSSHSSTIRIHEPGISEGGSGSQRPPWSEAKLNEIPRLFARSMVWVRARVDSLSTQRSPVSSDDPPPKYSEVV